MTEPLEWRVDFGAEKPGQRMLVLAIALGAAYIGLQLGGLLLSVIGFLVVVASTAELFLPLKYRLDESGAQVRCGISVTAVSWENVRRLIPLRDGLRLSPLEKPSRLDEFRGVYLRIRGNSEEVSGKIRQFWNGDTSALDRGLDRPGGGSTHGQAGGADPKAEARGAGDHVSGNEQTPHPDHR